MLELEAALVESAQINQSVADAKKELAAVQAQAGKERAKLAGDVAALTQEIGSLTRQMEQAREQAAKTAVQAYEEHTKQVKDLEAEFEKIKASKKATIEKLDSERESRKLEVESLTVQVMKLEQLRDDLKKQMAEIAKGEAA